VIRALVTGAAGQVGFELARELDGRAEVVARDRARLDISRADALAEALRELRPDLILNAAAYTAVDRAESEPEAARAANAIAPGVMAQEAKRSGALLVHFSTDYVFDGNKASPYVEDDDPNPLGVYGATKLAGEEAVRASGCDHLILRTSWVYGARGRNFLLTMLRLGGERSELRVVDDQRGAPTSSRQLACAVRELLVPGSEDRPVEAADLDRLRAASGTYHATAAGETTWFGFAQAIFAGRTRTRGRGFNAPRLIAIPTSEYPTPARRPANSVLSNAKLNAALGVRLPSWQAGLEETLSILHDN
jgi:dTDP-4-dehydrorhamnose reductase